MTRASALLDRTEQFIRTIPRLGSRATESPTCRSTPCAATSQGARSAARGEKAGWRGPFWRYYRDFDPNLASIRNEPEFKAIFADIERDMARQRAELAARPKDAPLISRPADESVCRGLARQTAAYGAVPVLRAERSRAPNSASSGSDARNTT